MDYYTGTIKYTVEMTAQIECRCGWTVRLPGWMAAYKAEQLVAAHRCELVEPAEGNG